MTRAVYRFREYRISPDLRPEADPITSAMECKTCNESGPAGEGTTWSATHLKAHPDHLEYREHITRPYWAEPGAWQ